MFCSNNKHNLLFTLAKLMFLHGAYLRRGCCWGSALLYSAMNSFSRKKVGLAAGLSLNWIKALKEVKNKKKILLFVSIYKYRVCIISKHLLPYHTIKCIKTLLNILMKQFSLYLTYRELFAHITMCDTNILLLLLHAILLSALVSMLPCTYSVFI